MGITKAVSEAKTEGRFHPGYLIGSRHSDEYA